MIARTGKMSSNQQDSLLFPPPKERTELFRAGRATKISANDEEEEKGPSAIALRAALLGYASSIKSARCVTPELMDNVNR
jgi:hypothetical protein